MAHANESVNRVVSVELRGPGEPCLVLGHTKPALGAREYALVSALLSAYPSSLNEKEMKARFGDDAHELVMALRKKDTSWSQAILVPSRSGRGGYRLL